MSERYNEQNTVIFCLNRYNRGYWVTNYEVGIHLACNMAQVTNVRELARRASVVFNICGSFRYAMCDKRIEGKVVGNTRAYMGA